MRERGRKREREREREREMIASHVYNQGDRPKQNENKIKQKLIVLIYSIFSCETVEKVR